MIILLYLIDGAATNRYTNTTISRSATQSTNVIFTFLSFCCGALYELLIFCLGYGAPLGGAPLGLYVSVPKPEDEPNFTPGGRFPPGNCDLFLGGGGANPASLPPKGELGLLFIGLRPKDAGPPPGSPGPSGIFDGLKGLSSMGFEPKPPLLNCLPLTGSSS